MSKIIGMLVLAAIPALGLAQTATKEKKEEVKTEVEVKAQSEKKEEVKTEVEVKAQSEKKEDEADQVITNRRLRADAGSLSKWSAAMYFNYQGGSLANPTQPERPNITNGKDALTLQNLTGELGVRYRLSALDSLTASTGFFMTTPFHSSIDTDDSKQGKALKKNFEDNHQELNFADPFIKYVHLDRVFGMQSVSTLKPLLITNNQQKEAGFKASYFVSQVFMKDAGTSGFSYGGAFQGIWYDSDPGKPNVSRNVIGFYPAAEYVINDTFNLRTVFGWQVYEQTRGDDTGTWQKRKVYESVGVGISLTRDIFLYPNVQFIPSDIRLDRTNVAISANINLF